MVPVRDGQELIKPAREVTLVLLPEKIVQKHPHRFHPKRLGQPEFLIDFLGIESFRLPHLQLVDCVRGNEVAADQPWLHLVPGIRLLGRPTRPSEHR